MSTVNVAAVTFVPAMVIDPVTLLVLPTALQFAVRHSGA
jgi:hypothetical protein